MYARKRPVSRALASLPGFLLALCLVSVPAIAAKQTGLSWLRVDRAEAEPSVFDGFARLRVYVTAVNLQGAVIEDITGNKAWTIKIGAAKPPLPYIAGTFEGIGDELAIAIVIQTSPELAEVLPDITGEVTAFLESLPKSGTQVAIVGYDDTLHGNRAVVPIGKAHKTLAELTPASSPGDKHLLDAIEQARRALRTARPSVPGVPLRTIIVVIGDGRDVDYPDPESYRKVSRRAEREGTRIHTLAFAADGNRLPLRGMAELSKRSHGTFRFVYTRAGFHGHFEQLRKEIMGQYVLTYYVPWEELQNKPLRMIAAARELESQQMVRVSKLVCGAAECKAGEYCLQRQCVMRARESGRGVLGWLLLIGGILLGVLLALAVLGLILGRLATRRQANLALMHAAQEVNEASAQPDVHRVSGQLPGGMAPPTGQHASTPYTGQHATSGSAVQHRMVQPVGMGGQPVAVPGPVVPPSLLVLKGPYQGRRIPLHHGFLIGKAPNCHMVLAGDNYASGHHAQILMDKGGGCTLVDQGSTNGTFINGVRTTQQRLSHGMLITIGSTEARFLVQ